MARLKRSALLIAVALLAAPADAARRKKVTVPPPAAPPAPPPPSVRQGVELWRTGNDSAAVAMWQPFAAAGDADAMFNLGQAHKLGRAVPRDAVLARDWFRRAAGKGHLPAQANLGILLFQAGEKAEAVLWLKTAADRGERRAQYVLGIAHWNGDGVARSQPLAWAYLTRAAAQGLPEGRQSLDRLNGTIAALDRIRGDEVAASLAAGRGLPPAFVPGAPREQMASAAPAAADAAPGAAARPASLGATIWSLVRPGAVKPVAETPAPPKPVPPPAPAVQTAELRPPAPNVMPPVATAPAPTTAPSVVAAAAPVVPTSIAEAFPAPVPGPVPATVRPPPPPRALAAAPVSLQWRVQLGAYSRRALAEAVWSEMKVQQKAVVGSRAPIFASDGSIVKLQLGPFADQRSARDVCARIAFSGRACFVTQG